MMFVTWNMSDRKGTGLYWRIKEVENKLKIAKSLERERDIVKKMSKKEIDAMHSDYLIMIAKEALEKKNEQTPPHNWFSLNVPISSVY